MTSHNAIAHTNISYLEASIGVSDFKQEFFSVGTLVLERAGLNGSLLQGTTSPDQLLVSAG